MKHVFLSDQGKVRSFNEDAVGVIAHNQNEPLYMIADGMGGHNAGDVASQMVLNYLQTDYPYQKQLKTIADYETYLVECVKNVNQMIYHKAKSDDVLSGMGTTVVLAVIVDDTCVIAHVGDSRCYQLKNGRLTQLTRDHSLVNVLVEAGEITTEEAQIHPKKNILTRAVGTDEDVEVEVTRVNVQSEMCLLLCTDGLTNKLTDHDLTELLLSKADLQKKAHMLIDEANARGGEDNITLLLIASSFGGDETC